MFGGFLVQAVSTSQREWAYWESSPQSHVEFHQEMIPTNIRCVVWPGAADSTGVCLKDTC